MGIKQTKVESFIVSFLDSVSDRTETKRDFLYNILMSSNVYEDNVSEARKNLGIWLTDEQEKNLVEKSKSLGYKNYNRFVRKTFLQYFLDNFGKSEKVNVITKNKSLMSNKTFESLMLKNKHKIILGDFTSYNPELKRDNIDFNGKIVMEVFDDFIDTTKQKHKVNMDFIEYDMLSFIVNKFRRGDIKSYNELIGKSTNNYAGSSFSEKRSLRIKLDKFVDYENIVPELDSLYYLYIYLVFTETNVFDHKNLVKVFFDTDDKYANTLLAKFTFDEIVNENVKSGNTDINKIFDKKLISMFKTNRIIKT